VSSFQVVRRQLNAHCLVHGERHPGPVRLPDSTTAAPLIGAIGTRNGWRYLTVPSGWSARAWSLSPSVSFPLQSCRSSAPLRLYVVRRMHYGQRFPSEIPSPIAYSNSGLTTPRRGVWRSGHIDPLVQNVCELYRVWLTYRDTVFTPPRCFAATGPSTRQSRDVRPASHHRPPHRSASARHQPPFTACAR
jgi:hypothetical protein